MSTLNVLSGWPITHTQYANWMKWRERVNLNESAECSTSGYEASVVSDGTSSKMHFEEKRVKRAKNWSKSEKQNDFFEHVIMWTCAVSYIFDVHNVLKLDWFFSKLENPSICFWSDNRIINFPENVKIYSIMLNELLMWLQAHYRKETDNHFDIHGKKCSSTTRIEKRLIENVSILTVIWKRLLVRCSTTCQYLSISCSMPYGSCNGGPTTDTFIYVYSTQE